jgi:flagellar biosynthesis GTPase FlhF
MPENTSSSSQKGRIFISYRRIDSEGYAGRIYDRLAPYFGNDAIFMDVDDIPAGVDFVKYLEKEVQSCDVLIALIGRQWLNVKDEHGIRRLDNPNDFVRIEIATALKRDIRVIPVLLGGAQMPNVSDLPENLQSLTRRNGVLVYHHSFHADTNRLIKHLEDALRAAEKAAKEKAAREKAEKESTKKARLEAEKQARQKAAKEKAEREAAKKAAREKAEKDAVEKARLEAEEQARQKAAKEKAESEAAEKAIREKTRLKAEEEERQRITKEKTERETAEKIAREKAKREIEQKAWFEKTWAEAEERTRQKFEKEHVLQESTEIKGTEIPVDDKYEKVDYFGFVEKGNLQGFSQNTKENDFVKVLFWVIAIILVIAFLITSQ